MADMVSDEFFMRMALAEAEKAAVAGDVPVGAIVVREGQVIGAAHNRREQDGSVSAHADILAMEQACRQIGSWRLSGCTLYVTMEPCPMCAGAILNGRVDRVVYGCKDARGGAMGSVLNVFRYPLGFSPKVRCGVCEEECRTVLRRFFARRR